eukprot:5239139-Pyramimonas_sp.AAC.1
MIKGSYRVTCPTCPCRFAHLLFGSDSNTAVPPPSTVNCRLTMFTTSPDRSKHAKPTSKAAAVRFQPRSSATAAIPWTRPLDKGSARRRWDDRAQFDMYSVEVSSFRLD